VGGGWATSSPTTNFILADRAVGTPSLVWKLIGSEKGLGRGYFTDNWAAVLHLIGSHSFWSSGYKDTYVHVNSWSELQYFIINIHTVMNNKKLMHCQMFLSLVATGFFWNMSQMASSWDGGVSRQLVTIKLPDSIFNMQWVSRWTHNNCIPYGLLLNIWRQPKIFFGKQNLFYSHFLWLIYVYLELHFQW
jgi:hypothetical protein